MRKAMLVSHHFPELEQKNRVAFDTRVLVAYFSSNLIATLADGNIQNLTHLSISSSPILIVF